MRGWCFSFFNAISTFTTSEFLQFSSEDSPLLQNHKLQEKDMAVDARKPATSLFHDLVAMPAHNDTQSLLNNPCTHNYNWEQTVLFCHCLTQHELNSIQCPDKPERNEGWSVNPLKLFICTELSSVTFHLYTGDAHDNGSLIFLVYFLFCRKIFQATSGRFNCYGYLEGDHIVYCSDRDTSEGKRIL